MDQDCIFCKIIKGEIPAAKVFENDEIFAFLDIAPVNKGHALVVPKTHYPTVFDLPPEIGPELVRAMDMVGRAVMEVTKAEGLNIMMNNYRTAGQLVDHAHFHLIPRFEDDGLSLWEQKPYDDNEEMNALAEDMAERIK
jgi:histidine triad (HIT) family protein